ncbi:helix-turn-helix domain-containing protein [Streptomyces sp. NPDC001220]
MTGHLIAPLTPEGRRRLCERVDAGRPVAHVGAEAGNSRRRLAKWYARWRAHAEAGLVDHSSRPPTSPARPAEDVADLIEALRRQTEHGPARLAADPQRLHGITVAPASVHRVLVSRGVNRLRDLDPPSSEQLREVIRYEHAHPGELVHVDIKKLGHIPAGGGWRMHGHGTDGARASKGAGPRTGKVGYTYLHYLHSALDDHSRLAYLEALEDEKAATAAAFWHRAVAFFAAHGVTPVRRVITTPARATAPGPGRTCSRRPAQSASAPVPTHREPTARSNGPLRSAEAVHHRHVEPPPPHSADRGIARLLAVA